MTIQVNVRVEEADRPLLVALAQKLRGDDGFRERFAAFLADDGYSALAERVRTLEQQVQRLASGAIVVPRSTPYAAHPSRATLR